MGSSRWVVYMNERFPLVVYLILVGGIALSSILVVGNGFELVPFLISFLGIFTFFAVLRLMDEYKDFEKDKIAHPERPLPRGLLGVGEVKRVILLGTLMMGIYGLFVGLAFNWAAGATFLLLTLHLWFMFKEFYVPHLEEWPLLYAVSHQLVLVWVCTFGVLLVDPNGFSSLDTYFYALLVLGAFFTYEVSRKQAIDAHPVLKTYRQIYGVLGSFLIIVVATLLSAYAGKLLGFEAVVWPLSIVSLGGFALWAKRYPKRVEAVASLSLVVHIWAVVIFSLKEWFV